MIFPALHQLRVGVRAPGALGLVTLDSSLYGEEEVSYLLPTRVEFGSAKHHTAVNITTDGRALLFRSEIGGGGAGISPRFHFSAGASLTVTVPRPMSSSVRLRLECE